MRLRELWLAAAIALVAVSTASVARQPHHQRPSQAAHSGSAYYTNVNGHRVHRPMRANQAPAGATAKCSDGTWSFSENHRGTCSHHGGVASWL